MFCLFVFFSRFCRIPEIHIRNVQDQSRTGERAEKLSEVERSWRERLLSGMLFGFVHNEQYYTNLFNLCMHIMHILIRDLVNEYRTIW